MTGHLRVSSPWSQLGIFLGLFGGAFVISSVLMGIFILAKGIPVQDAGSFDWSKPGIVSTMKWIQGISSLLIFLLPAVLYARICFTARPFYFLGLRKAEKSGMYGLAILCIMLAFP